MNQFYKKQILIMLVSLMLFCLWGCNGDDFVSIPQTQGSGEPSEEEKQAETEAPETEASRQDADPRNTTVFVHVCGCVNAAGVYELQADARIYEAVEMAGGFTADAASDSLNLAQALTDGQQIYVPSKEEAAAGAAPAGPAAGQNPQAEAAGQQGVNLNTAGREELMTLPGIGGVKADSIIRYREEHGGFKTPEEIMEIDGIKESIYEKIRDLIVV